MTSSEHGVYAPTVDTCLANGIAALPPAVQQTVLLNVSEADLRCRCAWLLDPLSRRERARVRGLCQGWRTSSPQPSSVCYATLPFWYTPGCGPVPWAPPGHTRRRTTHFEQR